jgi:hypothetical protein
MEDKKNKEPKAMEIDESRFTRDLAYRSEVLLNGLKHACHSRSIIEEVCRRLADEGLVAPGTAGLDGEKTVEGEGEEEESLLASDECDLLDEDMMDVQSPSDLSEAADLLQVSGA